MEANMTTLRQRHPHTSTSTSSLPLASTPPPKRPNRPRSYSLRQPRSTSVKPVRPSLSTFPSSLLESLDLPRFWSLRELLLGKLGEAEEDVRRLRELSSAEETEEEETTAAESEEDEEEEEDVWEVVTRRRGGKGKERSSSFGAVEATKEEVEESALEDQEEEEGVADLSTLRQFAKTASDFLSALRAELRSLSIPSTSDGQPLVDWQLSPEARLALDRFLEDHPLPSLPTMPALNLRARARRAREATSATALLTRVSVELAGVRDLLHQMNEASSAGVYSYLPSPSVPTRLTELRDYFSAESAKLSDALSSITPSSFSSPLRHLRDVASAELHSLQDGAHELSALLSEKSSAAMDEATRLYHAALEGGRTRLLRYEELPHAWRNNPHVLGGYRFVEIGRWGALLRSAFEWHNETINIQSHLLGFLSLVYLLVSIFPSSPHFSSSSLSAPDSMIALLFILAAMKCLLCSAAWHLLAGCATGHWHRGAACVDYVGISGLIAASVMGIEYYGFYCRPEIATRYMAFSAVTGVVGMYLPWKPWFNDRKFKMWRISFFLGLAGSALTPLAHLAILYGFSNTVKFFFPVGLSALAYLAGLASYATQFPECSSPGRWDNLLASHQLWHIAIVVAVWMHWRALTFWAEAASMGVDLSCAVR